MAAPAAPKNLSSCLLLMVALVEAFVVQEQSGAGSFRHQTPGHGGLDCSGCPADPEKLGWNQVKNLAVHHPVEALRRDGFGAKAEPVSEAGLEIVGHEPIGQ